MVPQKTYDLIVDTHENTTEECARLIIEMISLGQPAAFEKLTAAYPSKMGVRPLGLVFSSCFK